MEKVAFYTSIGNGNKIEGKSWNFYPKKSEYIQYCGHFIKGKVYRCIPTEKPGKIEVSGFFRMTFTRQRFEGGKLIDIKERPKHPGYYCLFFDASQCKEFLKFDRYKIIYAK